MDSQPPPKPWEGRIPGALSSSINYRSAGFGPATGSPLTSVGHPVLTRMAPPVPPRPVQQSYRPSYGSFTSSYSPYGSSFYGGGYSPYTYGSSYGMGGYRHFPHTEDVAPSRFVQQAEESSRGAFQSIESIVQAFTSVSMMLDATFSAVYNSFRAVLDVANHLTRLRADLTRVLSAFALVRTLRYIYRWLRRLLRRGSDGDAEDLWADSMSDALTASSSRPDGTKEQSVKSWPIFLFFAVVLGGPYLIWKLLSSSSGSEENTSNWASGEDDHVVARAEYDFSAASEEEISLRAGDVLNLAPKEQQPRVRGWLLASVNGQTTGLVPANYVKVLGRRRGHKPADVQRLVQSTQPSEAAARDQIQGPPTASNTAPAEQLLESVYAGSPGSFQVGTSDSSTSSSTALTLPEKTDL